MKAEGVMSRTKSETCVELIFVEWLYETFFSWGQVKFFRENIVRSGLILSG
jgi:hypothetical protein